MTDLNLSQARVWAEQRAHSELVFEGAAARLIQSLPDQWVDVEKVREIIEKMETPKNKPIEIGYDLGVVVATEAWRIQLEALLTPKLPTLADMTQEEREACQWMQCEIDGQLAGILARVDEQRGHIWVDSGYSLGWKLENITPLPDLPKLEWPGNEAVEPPALPEGMRLADHARYGRVVVSPKADKDDYHGAYYSSETSGIETGAIWGYAHKSDLTFLDGEA